MMPNEPTIAKDKYYLNVLIISILLDLSDCPETHRENTRKNLNDTILDARACELVESVAWVSDGDTLDQAIHTLYNATGSLNKS